MRNPSTKHSTEKKYHANSRKLQAKFTRHATFFFLFLFLYFPFLPHASFIYNGCTTTTHVNATTTTSSSTTSSFSTSSWITYSRFGRRSTTTTTTTTSYSHVLCFTYANTATTATQGTSRGWQSSNATAAAAAILHWWQQCTYITSHFVDFSSCHDTKFSKFILCCFAHVSQSRPIARPFSFETWCSGVFIVLCSDYQHVSRECQKDQ